MRSPGDAQTGQSASCGKKKPPSGGGNLEEAAPVDLPTGSMTVRERKDDQARSDNEAVK
jgi:hypothetical protein